MNKKLHPSLSRVSSQDNAPRLTMLAALIMGLTLMTTPPSASAASSAAAPAAAQDCGCELPWRTYTRKPTPEVLQLFRAARTADETTFARLIATIPDLNEYAVDDQSLLAALLYPVDGLGGRKNGKGKTWSQMSAAETAQLRAAHAATLAAKTRMLALALEHGASVKDTTRDYQRPPLHLAMVFGTPEMVRLLLKHGADPNQIESERNTMPIEFALDHEFFVRMTYLPELVDAPARTQMLLDLLAAGAKRPYQRVDEAQHKRGEALPRPAADYLIWPALAELTTGSEVMDAMAKTGTAPACDPDMAMLSPLGHAARAGNLEGVRWLKAHLPRTVVEPDRYGDGKDVTLDVWLAAAIWALYPAQDTPATRQRSRDILGELLVKDMPWAQENDLADDEQNGLIVRREIDRPSGGSTLLHHLVFLGDEAWVQRVVALGAPIDGSRAPDAQALKSTPLATAVRTGNAAMVKRLLALGADPLAGPRREDSPFFGALVFDDMRDDEPTAQEKARAEAARHAVLAALLAALTPAQKQALDAGDPTPIGYVMGRWYTDDDTATTRMLLDAGFSAAAVDAKSLWRAMRSSDRALFNDLVAHGAQVAQTPEAKAPATNPPATGTPATNPPASNPPAKPVVVPAPGLLVDALSTGRADLLEDLLRRGADPNQPNEDGMSAVQAAILQGDLKSLEVLLAHGARIDTTPRRTPDAPPSMLDLALSTGNAAMVARVAASWGGSLSSACMPGRDELMQMIVAPDDAVWNAWLNQGLARPADPNACETAPMAERAVLGALDDPHAPLVGWIAQRFELRLQALMRIATDAGRLTPARATDWLQRAREAGRDDVAVVLRHLGVAEPAPSKPAEPLNAKRSAKAVAADRALQKKLVGHYYLTNVREVGSELLLKANGRFEFGLAYGATDQQAQGQWTVRDGRVVFTTVRPPAPAGWQPFVLQPAPAPTDAGPRTVSVRYRDEGIARVTVTALGCTAPQIATGTTTDGGGLFALPLTAPICQIVLYHPQADGGRAFVQQIDAADANRQAFNFAYVPSEHLSATDFNVEMTVDRGVLVLERNGRPMRYERQ